MGGGRQTASFPAVDVMSKFRATFFLTGSLCRKSHPFVTEDEKSVGLSCVLVVYFTHRLCSRLHRRSQASRVTEYKFKFSIYPYRGE